MKLLREWWYRRLRRIDLEVLWPSILSQSPDLERAKLAFRLHAFSEKAWDGISWPEIEKMLGAQE